MSSVSNGNCKNLEGQKAVVNGATPARLGARSGARNIAPDHPFTRARRGLELGATSTKSRSSSTGSAARPFPTSPLVQ
jgi:hypothetical protein